MGLPARSNESVDEILARAAQRVATCDAGYVGDLTPLETAALLRADAVTVVDVRTEPEWIFVGHVPGSRRIEWSAPGTERDPVDFVAQIAQIAQLSGEDAQPIVFLCRSGARSARAARAVGQAGLAAYNMLEGFEGEADSSGQRGNVNGWRHAGLPWVQGREIGA